MLEQYFIFFDLQEFLRNFEEFPVRMCVIAGTSHHDSDRKSYSNTNEKLQSSEHGRTQSRVIFHQGHHVQTKLSYCEQPGFKVSSFCELVVSCVQC